MPDMNVMNASMIRNPTSGGTFLKDNHSSDGFVNMWEAELQNEEKKLASSVEVEAKREVALVDELSTKAEPCLDEVDPILSLEIVGDEIITPKISTHEKSNELSLMPIALRSLDVTQSSGPVSQNSRESASPLAPETAKSVLTMAPQIVQASLSNQLPIGEVVNAKANMPDLTAMSLGMLRTSGSTVAQTVAVKENGTSGTRETSKIVTQILPQTAPVAAVQSNTTPSGTNVAGQTNTSAIAGNAPLFQNDNKGLQPLSDEPLIASIHSSAASLQTRSQVAHPQQAYTLQVAQQIATALVQSKAGTTEIALNPEELGRVRISLTTADSGMIVSIMAERPETADLMRRNLEMLAREFRELGYYSVEFSFDQHSEESADGAGDTPQSNEDFETITPDQQSPHTSMTVALRGGLDLKL